MPKIPSFVNQVRRLRTEVLNMTQPRFARLIGVSPSMLQAVELGARRITDDFAHRVAYATGVDPECLLQERRELRTLMGHPYLSPQEAKRNREEYAVLFSGTGSTLSAEELADFGAKGALQFQDSFTSWKKLAGLEETSVDSYVDMLAHSIRLLFHAAARATPPKGRAVGHSLVRRLHQTAVEFDVLKHMESVLAERGEVPSLAPFLDESTLDRDPSMEWLFYRGKECSDASVDPRFAELAARHETRRRGRFRMYGKRKAKEQKALPPKSGKKTRGTA